MPQVTNTLVDTLGFPIQGALVTIILRGSWYNNGIVETIDSQTALSVTDNNGTWIVNLPSTSAIAGTSYYEAHEPNATITCFTVADTPPIQQLKDRIVNPVTTSLTNPTLDSLADVAINGPATGQFIGFDGSMWRNVSSSLASQTSQIRISGTAVQALSGHRIVKRNTDSTIDYATNTDQTQINNPFFMTDSAIVQGVLGSVVAYGIIDEPSWTWSPGPIFLGSNGFPTQVLPSSPTAQFLSVIGFATSATSILVNQQSSIKLA